METKENYFKTEKTARFYSLGELTEETKNIWFVCHGYGQLAANFIRKFEGIADENNFIIAPEGLHRYYLDKEHQKVGASWMTKEDRLNDIDDYVKMLDKIHHSITTHFKGKIIVLGFSQGVATVSRWCTLGKIKPDAAILWAGSFPPEIPLEKVKIRFENSHNFIVIGTEDEYFNNERINSFQSELISKGIKFDYISFAGKHVIDENILVQLKNKV